MLPPLRGRAKLGFCLGATLGVCRHEPRRKDERAGNMVGSGAVSKHGQPRALSLSSPSLQLRAALPSLSPCSHMPSCRGSWPFPPERGPRREVLADRLRRQVEYGNALRRRRLVARGGASLSAFGLTAVSCSASASCCCAGKGAACAVCLESMDEGMVRTSCGHEFHKTCMTAWAVQSASCPLCRAPLG